ncbi:RyR domain-containing protein [Deinococcus sp. QL22]|uniref:Acb2/Tad1 domain-containing protein n=1 Tax=Deinococcus sp. QL22 TaxID=2939437 RepID=UPI00201771F6|nr:RyR domain-containing protein [Deinococcus sp. QL22]UQN06778.1 hypothetical protein M1R55_02320 [Deinococcus sp. QL22]
MNKMTLMLTLAAIAHEANRHYCQSIGDTSQPSWDAAPDWQKESAIAGIEGALAGNTPEQQHESWMAEKAKMGTVYAPVKDMDATPPQHPCMVPYAELPAEQQRKDHLYSAVVKAAFGALTSDLNKPLPEIKPEPRPASAPKHPFEYQPPTIEQVNQIEEVRGALKAAYETLMTLPSSRERSLAITKLEEASMWANKGIVFH